MCVAESDRMPIFNATIISSGPFVNKDSVDFFAHD